MSRRIEFGTLGAGLVCIAMAVAIWFILASGMWGVGGGMFDWIGLISSIIMCGVGIWLIKGSYLNPARSPPSPSPVSPSPPRSSPQPSLLRTTPQQSPRPAHIQQRFCTNCGQPITEAIRFCGNCGTPITR